MAPPVRIVNHTGTVVVDIVPLNPPTCAVDGSASTTAAIATSNTSHVVGLARIGQFGNVLVVYDDICTGTIDRSHIILVELQAVVAPGDLLDIGHVMIPDHIPCRIGYLSFGQLALLFQLQ